MHQVSEMAFFCTVVKLGCLAAAAREMDLTPPAVSKRLAMLEKRLGVRLLNRTTRRITPTYEGEIYLANAKRILGDIDELESLISSGRAAPKGLLRVNAPLGFGRSYIGPALSTFSRNNPDVEFQLHLTDRPINLPDESIDVAIRFGEIPDSRLIAKKIASNRRLICASPSYLKQYGTPENPEDLSKHSCIILRQNDTAPSIWRLAQNKLMQSIKVHGKFSTNDGEVALNWALDGHGILMRAEWDVAKYLKTGRLIRILDNYVTPDADIYAVYLERLNLSAKVSFFVEHLREYMSEHAAAASERNSHW